LTKVTPALCIATSVPVPAGVVDAVARHGNGPPFRSEAADDGIFLVRQHFRFDIGDPKLFCSPVSIIMRIPSARRLARAPGVVALIGPATAMMPGQRT
jgi:hypothetical protein